MQELVQNLKHPVAWSKGSQLVMNEALKELLECQNNNISTIAELFESIHQQKSHFYEHTFLKGLGTKQPLSIDLKGKTIKGKKLKLRYTFYREGRLIIWLVLDISKVESSKTEDAIAEVIRLKKHLLQENKKLKKSDKKYRLLYSNTESPVIEMDQEFNVLSINKAFRKTFNYSKKFFLEKTENIKIWDLLKTKDLQYKIQNTLNNTTPKQNFQTLKVHNSKNQEFIVQFNIYSIKSQNESFNYQVILHDLTEKISKDNENFKHKNLELMERMAQIVAHEVRNPLNNIILAQSQIKKHSTDKVVPFIDIIDRNANRIEFLISRFLATFKKTELIIQEASLNKVLKKCFTNFKDKAKLTDTKLNITLLDNDLVLLMDEIALELAINNLINNAIQAGAEEEKRKVTITVKLIKNEIKIDIKDIGKGIESDFIQRIFDPFFSNKKSGLGLGLTTSMRIIEAHKGSIVAKNNKVKGATFSVLLPLD